MASRLKAVAAETKYIDTADVQYIERELEQIDPQYPLKDDPALLTATALKLRAADDEHGGEKAQQLADRIFAYVWLKWPTYRRSLASSRIAGELTGRLRDMVDARNVSRERVN